MTKFLPMMAIAIVLAIGGAYYMSQNNGTLPGISIAEAQEAGGDIALAPDMVMGAEDAPVTIVEYASFTCPHCANFHTDVLSQIKTNYIDTGKVRFVYREVYFDRYGLWAGMLARCGGDTRYFGLTDLIYEGQRDWIGSGEPQEVLANLRTLGRTAGMNDDEIGVCLEDQDLAQSMVAAYQQNAAADEINATPSFVVNGEKYSNMSYADFAKLIEEKLTE